MVLTTCVFAVVLIGAVLALGGTGMCIDGGRLRDRKRAQAGVRREWTTRVCELRGRGEAKLGGIVVSDGAEPRPRAQAPPARPAPAPNRPTAPPERARSSPARWPRRSCSSPPASGPDRVLARRQTRPPPAHLRSIGPTTRAFCDMSPAP